MKRKSWPQPNDEDSNSDEESLKQLINDSRDQLNYAKEIYEQLKLGIHNHLVTNEIVSTSLSSTIFESFSVV